MNKTAFQKAFDSIHFSEDFNERTVELLHETPVKKSTGKGVWRAVLVTALAAVMGISALAVSGGIDLAQVVSYFDIDRQVADLLDGEESIIIEESQPLGDYIVTLHGIATGEVDSVVNWMNLPADKSYIVFAVRRKDGAPVSIKFLEDHYFTPVVDGYAISSCDENGEEIHDYPVLTLNASGHGTVKDGVFYYLYETANLELFADHTVKFAVYYAKDSEGTYLFPSYYDYQDDYKIFTMSEDGTNLFWDGFTLPHAMFTLPLDESKADPAAAQALLEERAG